MSSRLALVALLAWAAAGSPVTAADQAAAKAPATQVPAKPSTVQVAAKVPAAGTPAWDKGVQPISRESYWHAVECGKKGGENPACVFFDTGLCQNGEFTLALYTPYKMVAYAVWQAVRAKKEPPTPSYPEAQRTRVVLGVKALRADNPLTSLRLKRGTKAVAPASQTLDAGGGTFVYDFAAFAPTAGLTLELAGRSTTVTCTVSAAVLRRLR
jgi:hypothetical protein